MSKYSSYVPRASRQKVMIAEVNGGDQLEMFLRHFPKRIQKDIVNASVARGAAVLRKAVKDNIKKMGLVRSGNLLGSVKRRKKKGTVGVYQVYTDKRGSHSHLIEFGTSPRKLKKPLKLRLNGTWVTVKHTGSTPARPFFRNAIDESKDRVRIEMMKAASRRMEREANKMSQKFGTLSKSYRRKLRYG